MRWRLILKKHSLLMAVKRLTLYMMALQCKKLHFTENTPSERLEKYFTGWNFFTTQAAFRAPDFKELALDERNALRATNNVDIYVRHV